MNGNHAPALRLARVGVCVPVAAGRCVAVGRGVRVGLGVGRGRGDVVGDAVAVGLEVGVGSVVGSHVEPDAHSAVAIEAVPVP